MKKVIDFNRLPKQEYINPKMEVVELHTPQILAGSPELDEEYNGEIIL